MPRLERGDDSWMMIAFIVGGGCGFEQYVRSAWQRTFAINACKLKFIGYARLSCWNLPSVNMAKAEGSETVDVSLVCSRCCQPLLLEPTFSTLTSENLAKLSAVWCTFCWLYTSVCTGVVLCISWSAPVKTEEFCDESGKFSTSSEHKVGFYC